VPMGGAAACRMVLQPAADIPLGNKFKRSMEARFSAFAASQSARGIVESLGRVLATVYSENS
jgi:hypothetical protein